jgi:gliding motility-associated-like protein
MQARNIVLFFLLQILSLSAYNQIFTTNGAVMYMSPGSILHSNGGMQLTAATNFTNNGALTVTKNSTLPIPGNFEILGVTAVTGNGLYNIEQDWVNDASFTAGTGTVEFYGDTRQFITSNNGTQTTFHNLILSGTGALNDRKKSLTLDASIDPTGTLTINDRELETQANIFDVLNPLTASVSNSTTPGNEGFVSSTGNGYFQRATNSISNYTFPTGSSDGTLRYRPVIVSPQGATSNQYSVRFNNYDANTDGFLRSENDNTMCDLLPQWYHSVERTSGAAQATIQFHFIPAADGDWDGVAHRNFTTTLWENSGTVSTGTTPVFSTLETIAWNFALAGHPFILTRNRPAAPTIVCNDLCENSSGNIFTASGGTGTYVWQVPSGVVISSGQGTPQIETDWGSQTGYVSVYAEGIAGCNSLPDSCQPVVLPQPNADFSYTASGDYGQDFQFLDQSTGASDWFWSFGTSDTSVSQNPAYSYNTTGDYQVTLIVSNGFCSDTVSITVSTGEGINIPNIITPNGDAINDELLITASTINTFSLQIFNRWGQLMFESDDINTRWKGTTLAGNPCPDGTYYYVLKADTPKGVLERTGTITIVKTQ